MEEEYKKIMLQEACNAFNILIQRRKKKLFELSNVKNHDLNPLLDKHKALFVFGSDDKISLAKSLIYTSIIGTGLNTSFGNIIQKEYLLKFQNVKASPNKGLDIEFKNQVTNEDNYCELKAGINTINDGDVEPLLRSFISIMKVIAQNKAQNIPSQNFIIGVFSGKYEDRNGAYKKIENRSTHKVLVGTHFWEAITGDNTFYDDLSKTLQDFQLKNSNHQAEVKLAVNALAKLL
jgi:hypothetical protein